MASRITGIKQKHFLADNSSPLGRVNSKVRANVAASPLLFGCSKILLVYFLNVAFKQKTINLAVKHYIIFMMHVYYVCKYELVHSIPMGLNLLILNIHILLNNTYLIEHIKILIVETERRTDCDGMI